MSCPSSSTRRRFLRQASALSTAAILPFSISAQQHASAGDSAQTVIIPNQDTLLKFNPDGSRRPFAGNTVICHLPVQCAMRDAMTALHDDLAAAPFRHKLGLTSLDSYHMTIFPGANDQDRDVSGWPSYVPLDASIETCTQMVGDRMAQLHLRGVLPLRVSLDIPATCAHPTACSLRMAPADAAQNRNLRSIRDQLAEAYGFRLKDHDVYAFHITMSYQLAPFTGPERAAYQDMLKRHARRIATAAPILEFGLPEYCTFPDMFRFEPQRLLAC